eukprot:s948_g7.t1
MVSLAACHSASLDGGASSGISLLLYFLLGPRLHPSGLTALCWSVFCNRVASARDKDRSRHCRTPSSSSRSQWALPDLIYQIAVGTAGLHLPAPDPSGHCRTSIATARSQWALHLPAPDPSGHCRTSIATARSQWALLDFIRELQISVGSAGLQPRAPDPSGHCRTSTASSRSQWALPDVNRELQIPVGTAGLQLRLPDPSGHCRTSTAR